MRFDKKLWSFPKWNLIILGLLVFSYIVTFSYLSILRHNGFASNFDLANMDQTIWNTLHGRIFEMTTAAGNVSRLATHADFILILLSPLYLIWNDVRMLLIIQSVFLGLGAVGVYLIARQVLKSQIISLILSAVFLLNPALQWTNIYDFHGVALAIPLLLFTYYFSLSKNWKWYWLFFILALITKEEVSLFLVVLGGLMAIVYRSWKVGIISIVVGVTWFLAMVFVVIPYFNSNGQHWAFNTWFVGTKADLDHKNYLDILQNVRKDALTPMAINYYDLLLKPFGFLPLLGWPWLLLAGPELLINILSNNPGMETIILHYTSVITPALIISTIFAFKYLLTLWQLVVRKAAKLVGTGLAILLLVVALRVDYNYGPLPVSPSCWCLIYRVENNDVEFEKILQRIPAGASIAASGEIRPHLTHRQNAFNLPFIPAGADYVALIDEERGIGSYKPRQSEIEIVRDLQSEKSKYQLVNHLGHFYLFKRRNSQF